MKHLFSFRQRPNETLTHSTTRGLNGSRMVVETTVKGRSNDCRMTVGRLSTLFLLLFALSFGFNQEVKAKTIYLIPNSDWKSSNAWFQVWDGSNNINFTETSISGVYKADIKSDAGNITLKRMKPNESSTQWNYWNTNASSNNRFEVTGWDNTGNASKIIGIVTGGYLYFDNSCGLLTSSKHQFAVGHSKHTKLYELTNISGTNLYYTTPTDKWPDATYYTVMSNSSLWGNGDWGYTNINDHATKATAEYNGPYDLNSGNTYVISASGSSKGSTMSITWKDGYSSIDKYKHTLNVYTRTSVDGSTPTYSQSTNSPTNVTLKGKKLNGNGTATDATATVSTSAKTASVSDVVMTSTLTGSYTALSNGSAWVFDGWSTGGTSPTSTTSPYTINNAKEAKTMNAYFTLRQFSVSYGVNGGNGSIKLNSESAVTTSASKNINYGTSITFTATPNSGYAVEGWYSDASCTSKITAAGTETSYQASSSLAAATIVYVKFKQQTYQVTFDVHSSGHGSIEATANNVAFNSGDEVNASVKVVFTATSNTGYHVAGWYSDAACTQVITGAGTGTSYTISSLAKAETVYVKFAANTYNVVFNGKGNTSGSMSKQVLTYDAEQNLTSNAFVKTGYTFQGWDTNSAGTTVVYTDGQSVSNLTEENNATINLYAVWQINTYNITYPASPAHYTITENTTSGDYNTSASFKATPEDGYRLVVTATKAGGGSVSLSQNNYSYSFNIPADNVTISVTAYPYRMSQPNPGSQSNTLVDFTDGVYQVSLNENTWYTFRLYNEGYTNKSSHYMGSENSWNVEENLVDGEVTMHTNAAAFYLCTGVAGTYTFTIKNSANNKPVLSITYPNVSTLTIDHQSKADDVLHFTQVGSSNIWRSEVVALEQNKTYNTKFYWEGAFRGNKGIMVYDNHTGWHMQHYNDLGQTFANMKLQTRDKSHNAGNYYFEFNTENHYLTAVYPSYFRSNGDGIGWDNSHPLTFDENGIAVFEFEATRAYKGDGILQVKVVDEGQYYTLDKMVTTSASNEQFIADPDENKAAFKVQIVEEMLGKYTFTYNKKNHQMSVNYPDTEQFEITYTDAEGTKTIMAGPHGGRGISAANKPGYRFTGWVISPDNTYLTVADNDLSRQTTTVYGKKDGGSLTATYSNDEFIYFKNIPGWSNVNVYFYSEDYFNPNNGSGCLADGDQNKRKAYGWAMTHIPNTDIWYLDYKNMDRKPNVNIVAFSDHLQNGNQWFYECQVAYRKDFSSCTPMYMPVNWIHERLNDGKTAYYEQGCWMKFDSQESGYEVKLYDKIKDGGTEMASVDLTADGAGGYVFTGTINISFEGKGEGWNYGFKIKNKCNSTYFGNNGTMTSSNCTNWEFNSASDMQNCGLETTTKGDYIFTISFDGGIMHVSVEYPLSNGDYRVVYKEGINAPLWNGYYYKKSATDRKDTASFFIKNGVSATVELQRGTDVSANPAVWEKVMDINTSSLATGVYNFEVSQTNAGTTATLTQEGLYTGNYYIRTDGVDGGWKGFAKNPDNLMTYYGSMLDAGVTYDNFQYDYYKAKWIEYNKNVKFCIANDYSKNISAEFAGDATLNDNQVLPQNTNVRFMWNSETNQLSRAYISGSTDIAARFLVMIGDDKMFDKDGNALTEVGGGKIPGLNDYELNFADNNNWVYQADIKAQPGCAVRLIATYNGKTQYFIGSNSEPRPIISGGEDDTQYTMRAVYDFKTNRLIVGWIPPEGEIDKDITLGGDILLIRTHQGDVQQIVFNQPATEVSEIQHIYGVLTLQKDKMIGTNNTNYEKTMYWISFPFDVKLSQVFGTGIYGTDWIVQRYRGDLRAQKGWFRQDTQTFWEYMELTDTLKAYEGYVFLVDANKFNTNNAEAWKNSATEANFYFPSASGEIGIIHQATYPQTVPEHECKIDREFEVEGVDGKLNHKITDSHWNVIGVPAFQNNIPSATPLYGEDFKSYYEWDHSTNKYKAKVVLQGTEFHTMHAYMVQFAGTITWSDVSVVKQNAPSRELAAQYADAQSYLITLRINDGKDDDQTYIRLSEKADAEFVLNEDMMKMDNTGSPNIYSFAGNYNVAYNETGMENQTINLGVNVPKNGNYTFSMPDNFNGSATLVDVVEGKVTELNVSDYTVTLNKGTYNNRFQLVLIVNSPIVTNMDEINNGWNADGKTKKLLINNTIYLINGGHIYNASGMELSK